MGLMNARKNEKVKIRVPFFETSVKCYIYGDEVLKLAKAAQAASIKYDTVVIFFGTHQMPGMQ